MVRAADLAASLGDPSDTISSKINMISERAVLWNDSSTVKEAVERLREGSNLVEILEEVKEQLHVNPPSHNDFLTAGGAQVLCGLLSSGNTAVQHKCLCALEALALNLDAITHLKETTIVDVLVEVIHSSHGKVNCRRRDKAGTIIKLLAGWQPGRPLYPGHSNEFNTSTSSLGVFQIDRLRDRPLPLWYHTTSSIFPWDAEAVSCLVDLLTADLGPNVHETAERAIKKILRVRELTRHIILDKRDVADLVSVISSMHSTAAVAMKVVTFMSIMHPSNEVTFVRTGGLEGLVKAMSSDNIGSISGEMAAWVTAYFASRSPVNSVKIVEAGGAEALVELLHSPDYCAREASARACISMLTSLSSKRNVVRKRFGEANAIPALLSALQDGQYQSREQAVLLDLLRALMDMAKLKDYRKEILNAGGLQTLKESVIESGYVVQETSRKLKKILVSRSTRLRMAFGTAKAQAHGGFAQKFSRSMKKIFCHKSSMELSNTCRENTTDAEGAFSAPDFPGRWSANYQGDSMHRTFLRRARSTVSLTSFGAHMAAAANFHHSATDDSDPFGKLCPSCDSSSLHQRRPQHRNAKIRQQEHYARPDSLHQPTLDDLAVVVVTLNTQSSASDGNQHQGDFIESSQSDLIATCDFI